MADLILVTGAAGQSGLAVIRALARRGAIVRALVRRDAQAASVRAAGARDVAIGDLRDDGAIRAALDGARAVYHICPNVQPDEPAIGRRIIDAAQAAGVDRFVFQSVIHALNRAMPHHANKLLVEEQIVESGLDYTILQPTVFMQNTVKEWPAILAHGTFDQPYSADARMCLVDLEDVAEAAAICLTEPGYAGAIFELCGPRVLTRHAMAAIIGAVLGRPVRAVQGSFDAWLARFLGPHPEPYRRETLGKMMDYYDRHGLAGGNPLVLRTILGRAPTDYDDFIRRLAATG
jgi:NAD(P)H dehydrogenase (quinone)